MASHAGGKESRENEPEYVMGLEKGLSIIEAFGMKKGPLTLTQAAEIPEHRALQGARLVHPCNTALHWPR
jgi:IclR family transcriptional regulator, pca regulon regulatory protein